MREQLLKTIPILLLGLLLGGPLVHGQPTDSEWQGRVDAGQRLMRERDYEAAEKSFLAAVEEARRAPLKRGRLALSCNEVGALYLLLGRYAEAERFLHQAMLSWQEDFPPSQPGLLRIVNHLAQSYLNLGHLGKAERICRFAMDLPSANFLDSVRRLENLGTLYLAQRKCEDAESTYRQAEAIVKQELWPDHAELAAVLNNLGIVCARTGRPAEAIPHFERALAISRRTDENKEGIPQLLANLGNLYGSMGRVDEAERVFAEALGAAEQCASGANRAKLEIFSGYATLLRGLKRRREAKEMEARARSLQENLSRENPFRYSVDVTDFRRSAKPDR